MSLVAEMREVDQIDGVPAPEQQPAVIGHRQVLDGLEAQFAAGRIPGGLLVHGPRGIGKATLAFALARRVLETTGDEDAHRVGEQVAAGSHPNMFVLRKPPRETRGYYTVIRVEDVRTMREEIRMTRGRAGHRVAIIDSVDDCNASSANALLKILEEPPPETLFLLVSHRPGQLLPTIRSRCQAVALRPLADEAVMAVLRQAGGEAAPERLAHAVSLARGRPRRAFEALAMTDESTLAGLTAWLADPAGAPVAVHLGLADALAANAGGPEMAFARDLVLDWIAAEARRAAMEGPAGARHLASANELWEKATSWFSEADSLNLDARQTLTSVFDAVRAHVGRFASLPAPE